MDCSYLRGPDYLEVSPLIGNKVAIQILLVDEQQNTFYLSCVNTVQLNFDLTTRTLHSFWSCTDYKPSMNTFLVSYTS